MSKGLRWVNELRNLPPEERARLLKAAIAKARAESAVASSLAKEAAAATKKEPLP